jgi:threonine synthase
MAAAVDMPTVILAPKTAPQAKIAQLLIFGARVFLVDGSYDDAFNLSLEAAEAFGWYCRNTGYNPFTAEGKKTAAFEICEQLTIAVDGIIEPSQKWRSPDTVFVSVGDGNIISGLHKGFKDLKALGWIENIPRLFGVQSGGSAAIYNAFVAGTENITPVRADTIADSISVDYPRDGLRALRAATQTGGAYLSVRDEDILTAMIDLARQAAVFAEPAGAAAYAGLVKAVAEGLVEPGECIVVINTGNGLKDVQTAMQAAGEASVIEPTLTSLQKAIGK